MMLAGQGFKITEPIADRLVSLDGDEARSFMHPYLGGSELLHGGRGKLVIDLHGLSEPDVRRRLPATYDYLLQNVWPERQKSRDAGFRERWWVFGRVRPELRAANSGLSRYIATTETSAHRIFQFLPVETLLDHSSIAISTDSGFHLGVLSSRFHVEWALRTGAWLGGAKNGRRVLSAHLTL